MTWKCPSCKSDNLIARVGMRLIQEDDENFQTEEMGADHEWDEDSLMVCMCCDEIGESHKFEEEGE